MAGRKAVMVDTETWNRLEKYRYDSYVRSIGDVVSDLLDVTTSHSYYAGIRHEENGNLLVCSIGRTDEEALRNLMSRENLLRSDIITFEDYEQQEDDAEFYFTVPCTKEVYDFFNLLHNYLPLEYPNGSLSLDWKIDNNASDFKCSVNINEIWGIADLIPRLFAFVVDDDIYVSNSLYDFFYLPMRDYAEIVRKHGVNLIHELLGGIPTTIIDALMMMWGSLNYNDEIPRYSELIHDLDNLDYYYGGNQQTIFECSGDFYKEAVLAGHDVHTSHFGVEFNHKRDIKYVYNDDFDLILTVEENDLINIGLRKDVNEYEYLQKFRRSVIVIKDNVPFVYSVGKTVNEALRNVKDMDYSNPVKYDSYSVEWCSKELYLAAIQAELFEDNKLIECVRVDDNNGTVYYDVVKSEN